ncbi:MAG: hypothetical protein MUF63_01185 [Rhodobacteraceae bacterium]|jgi:hypothetical protein|nr:hypothetical protein [Paracoccaceae bacterium]
MPSNKLIAIVTALTCLAGARGAYAAASADQLAAIEDLIVSRNCGGLRSYLDQYPVLLEGSDPLAEELRNFANGIDSGLISCLSFRSSPDLGPGLAAGTVEIDLGTTIY